jgi:type IV secretory pathway TraG/TraD family ATPase VirD4
MSFQGFLDNCHVAFATNNERIARCVSDALGTTTELRAMNNHAGHRLSSWLGHLIENLTTTPTQCTPRSRAMSGTHRRLHC